MSSKKIVSTTAAPQAIGPYSQAVVANGLLFVSGCIPLDPATGQVVPGEIQEQATRVLENLNAIVTAAGSSLDRVLKTTVFIKDMNQFAAVNAIYANYFHTNPPARSTVEVSRLPKDVLLEIEAIATVD